jgi:DNA helicase-2/ATP-dependent DNA helicase PcrA
MKPKISPPIQHEMLLRFSSAKIVCVGDRHQAIYGFRGASHNSMDELKEMFTMRELPLSVCYRCPREVILYAQEFCPEITWRDNAPEGKVAYAESDPLLFPDSQFILCRNNAPLFTSILRKVRAQEPCQVMSSFLDSFQSFIRAFKSVYTSDLLSKAENWKARELDAAKTKSKVSLIHDKFDTLVVLSKGFAKTDDVLRLLMRLKESRSGPIFATIHKAKGLESENIYILRPDLLSGFYASSEEQKQQEDNLHYVAITRAQAILTYGAER